MNRLLLASTVAAAATLVCGAALAQGYTYNPSDARSYEQQQRDYQASQEAYRNRVDNYQSRVDDYRARQEDYQERQEDYIDQQAAIDAQRDAYFRARDAYDRRWGAGAYDRTRPSGYIPRPADLGPPAYAAPGRTAPAYTAPAYTAPTYAPARAPAPAYRDTCRERGSRDAAATGYIQGRASTAIGSDAARRSSREGEVLGALVDVTATNRLNRGVAMCDGAGYFYSFDQTFPYRETPVDMARGSGRYDYGRYVDMRCRLAIAPAQWGGLTDYRYIRVCPDGRGRYRITS